MNLSMKLTQQVFGSLCNSPSRDAAQTRRKRLHPWS
ncbi:hypothetical protein Ae406Ps2_6211 [Pseudonocardia sp. Ae406_Ps2]|nr:hypothetical protein Ae406Ps2_6207 [Pseudonocardia sp. Ae406_Ps2]OLL90056.1 hypothetical protein Ae406Ps2_6211 [Pseudonocardia sp. Ae406_Ps2]